MKQLPILFHLSTEKVDPADTRGPASTFCQMVPVYAVFTGLGMRGMEVEE